MNVVILVALYGIALFTEPQCDIALRLNAPGIAILWGYFGYDETCLLRFMPKLKYIEIHPSFHATKVSQSVRHKNAIYRLCEQFPEVACLVSLGLEDKYRKTQAAKALKSFLRGKPSNVTLLRNSASCPRCRSRRIEYYETHTNRPSAGYAIASNDGWGLAFSGKKIDSSTITFEAIEQNIKDSKGLRYYVLWWGEAQGIGRQSDRNIPARKRIIQITRGQVREINQLLSWAAKSFNRGVVGGAI